MSTVVSFGHKTALEAFKNERDYVAQGERHKSTVAAMDWAIEEIGRLRVALGPFAFAGRSKSAEHNDFYGALSHVCINDLKRAAEAANERE